MESLKGLMVAGSGTIVHPSDELISQVVCFRVPPKDCAWDSTSLFPSWPCMLAHMSMEN